ncbi:MAG: TrkA C-terminal domain-containing protein [Deltaproteobacteria bacterium]|nr:TrkA C-terminal domain-containing protein [Deltaproteobacteria bacterium]
MLAILSLLLVLTMSMVVVRIGAVALRLTGMPDASARFQARSAFTGAGFTTTESEQAVDHPLRRKIISLLMVAGNVGITAASSTLILSVIGLEEEVEPMRLVVLICGVILLLVLTSSKLVDRLLCGVISWGLSRYTSLETRDFSNLLHLGDDYHVAELALEAEDWLVGKTIQQAQLAREGALVLGVKTADGSYQGLPSKDFLFAAGQTLTLYGKANTIEELDCRCTLPTEPTKPAKEGI